MKSRSDIPPGDYVSEGLQIVIPDTYFPNMVIGDKTNNRWPYLRRQIGHNWYCDRRAPQTGFVNRDEAILLYNLALPFSGKPALEIGCWMGWSTCHLALAGLALDIIDPVLGVPENVTSVRQSLMAAGVLSSVRMYAAPSPQGVKQIAELTGTRWNFFFIDGDHEASAPERDARECLQHAADDAMIVFHDLVSPDVERGLDVLRRDGWEVLVYQTMQIMGVAWRGNVRPVKHKPDPAVVWNLPLHLAKYQVSGSSIEAEVSRLAQRLASSDNEITKFKSDNTCLQAEVAAQEAAISCLQAELTSRINAMGQLDSEVSRLAQSLAASDNEITKFKSDNTCLQAEVAAQETTISGLQAELTSRISAIGQLDSEVSRLAQKLAASDNEITKFKSDITCLQGTLTAQEATIGRLQVELTAGEGAIGRLQAELTAGEGTIGRLQAELTTREGTIGRLQAELTAGEGTTSRLQAELTTAEGTVSGLQAELTTAERTVSGLQTELTARNAILDRLAFQAAKLDADLNSVLQSRSWRVTAPLRTFKGVVRVLLALPHRGTEADSREGRFQISGPSQWAPSLKRLADLLPERLRTFVLEARRKRTIARSGLFDAKYYLAQNPDVAQDGMSPLEHYLVSGAKEGRDPHPLFDSSYYLESNPDVIQDGMNPLEHYLVSGAKEGRDPHPLFDSSYYLEANPDVARDGMNPLEHYLVSGAKEGRDPHPLFDSSYYLEASPDVARNGMNPLEHYLVSGAKEGRDPNPLFDTSYYLEANPDVVQNGMNPLAHYVVSGAAEGRDPNPLFDSSYYLEANPDVAQDGMNPLEHYLVSGAKEGRDPDPLFDSSYYLERNPDVAQDGMNPLEHFLVSGAREGRNPNPLFDTSYYLEANPDVAQDGMNPLEHYLVSGVAEGRDPNPLFDTSYYLESNPDVAQDGMNPLEHYFVSGVAEGRDPNPFFDTSYYLEANPDVAQDGMNPLDHFLVSGAKEGRDPHPLFDTSFYLEQKPEVAVLDMNPLVHFLKEGPGERFDPTAAAVHPPDGGICIVTPDIVGPVKNGGIGTACYHFALTLVEAGHPVSILFTGDLTDCQKAHWKNIYAKMRINFIAFSDTPPEKHLVWGTSGFLERSWRVFQYLREAKFSVVHFQDWQGNGFWSIKAKQVDLCFSKTVLTVMTHSCTKWINQGMQQFSSDPLNTAKLIWAETYAVEHCDLLLSPSQYMLNWATENGIRCPARVVRTPCIGSEPAGDIAGQVDNDHLIFFGRLETRKGLHIFGEALRQLSHDGVALPKHLSFLGKHALVMGRPSENYLEELKEEFETIEFHIINNFDHADALRYIRESRGLVVIPSLVDNHPMTVVECIQNRIPFVAAATGGIPEMIDGRISFEPTPFGLSRLLTTRREIDHHRLEHRYSASLAKKIWCELHIELLAGQQKIVRSFGERGRRPLKGMKVSVCIPFFNHHRYLATLIGALSRQRYSDFEVILVNDGSCPEAKHEFDRLAAETRDARFRFLTTENRGPGLARNFAVSQAGGELLVFFDSDNLPKSQYFVGTLVRAIQESEADCVTCPYDIVDANRCLPTEADVVSTYRPIGSCVEVGFFENILGDATMIIKRTVFEKLGGFSANRASWEDHEFLLNLCFRGFKLESLPEALFYYRRNSAGRNHQANLYLNYESLFRQLQVAAPADLARILGTVGGPLLLRRNSEAAAGILAW